MNWPNIQSILFVIQHIISTIGVLIIFTGAIIAVSKYIINYFYKNQNKLGYEINTIRLYLGRIITLGLEFIVAADLIGTTTAPDYYTVGLLGIIILIRTLLSYSLNRELQSLSQEQSKMNTYS